VPAQALTASAPSPKEALMKFENENTAAL